MRSEISLENQHRSNNMTIRRQLVWAAVFPLVLIGMLSTLVTSVAVRELAMSLVMRRSTTLVQAVAANLALVFNPSAAGSDSLTRLPLLDTMHLYLIDPGGNIAGQTDPSTASLPLRDRQDIRQIALQHGAHSLLRQSTASGGEVVTSYAPISNTGWGLILEESWQAILSPVMPYVFILLGLLIAGILLSVNLLSLSIERVIRPLADLSHIAAQVVPGSTFRPIPERGPAELQALTQAFNQMVIRLAEQQAALRQYAQKALLSQEEERQRLSHELHDVTVQDLVGLVQRIDLCRSELDRDPQAACRRLEELNTLARQTLDDVRRISNALRPSILEDLGLPAALQALCEELEQQMPEVACICTVEGHQQRLASDLELAIFRISQEALSNIRRHAQAVSEVKLLLDLEDLEVRLTISDDGSGFAVPGVRTLVREGHLGLAGMYERARLFGGELAITSQPGSGVVIHLRLPSTL